MLLGMKIGLSPVDFVLNGDPAAYPKGAGAPLSTIFVGTQLPPEKVHIHPTQFCPMFIVAKRLDG